MIRFNKNRLVARARLRLGYCPACYSSPPRDDCPVCLGERDYGSAITQEHREVWRKRFYDLRSVHNPHHCPLPNIDPFFVGEKITCACGRRWIVSHGDGIFTPPRAYWRQQRRVHLRRYWP